MIMKNKSQSEQLVDKKKSINDIKIPNWVAILVIVGVGLILFCVFFLPKIISHMKETVPVQNQTSFVSEPSPDAVNVEVLPQRDRIFDENAETANPFTEEVLSKLKLTGIIKNSNDEYTAILEANDRSFILCVDDFVGDTKWQVGTITDKSVILKLDDVEKIIEISSSTNNKD